MGTNYYARIIPSKKRVENLKNLISSGNLKITDEVQKMYGEYIAGESEGGSLIHLGKKSGGWKFLWNPNVSNVWEDWEDGMKLDKDSKPVYTLHKIYDLTAKGIMKFLQRKDIVITDEYCEIDTIDGLLSARDNPDNDPDKTSVYTFEQFWKLSYIDGGKEDLFDGKTYDEYSEMMYNRISKGDTEGMTKFDIDTYKYPRTPHYYPSELAWLEQQYGYKLTSYGDFYSDGLRFATSVNFS